MAGNGQRGRMSFGYKSTGNSLPNIRLLAEAPITLSFDVEATGTNVYKDKALGVSVAASPGSAYWFPLDNIDLKKFSNKLTIAHNAKYDYGMLKKNDIHTNSALIDTMIAAHMLGERELSLKKLALSRLGIDIITYSDIGMSFEGMNFDDMAEFSGAHSITTLLLWKNLRKDLSKYGMLNIFHNVEMPLIPVLSDMEIAGVAVDRDTVEALGVEFKKKRSVIRSRLNEISGRHDINYNSHEQLARLLYDTFGLPPSKKVGKKGIPSVEGPYLETLRDKHPFIPLYLKYKMYQTLISGYSTSLLKDIVDGRVHASFNQTGTVTGRLSSSNPNMQKIPKRSAEGKRIRTAFIAPPGFKLIRADASQLEFRVGGICANDKTIINAYLAGRDIHDETARRAFGGSQYRGKAKRLNFQVEYGGGSYKEKKLFAEAYPEYEAWRKKIHHQVIEDGYVRTLNGRIRIIPEARSDNSWLRKHGLNEAVSTVVQGTSAEIIKQAMVRAWSALSKTNARLVLAVHDEMVYEVPGDEADEVIDILKKVLPCYDYLIPIEYNFEIGQNWGQMEEV